MIIVGAKGFAKELLQNFHDSGNESDIAFFDDLNPEIIQVFNQFPVLKNDAEVMNHFRIYGNDFILGIGNSLIRYRMARKFQNLGGHLKSCISPFARIGNYDIQIGEGATILAGSIISNNVTIGNGCLIYYNSVVTHDCQIGDFVEISPAANILGRCKIGNFTQVGANATILPDITVGENVIVGAGAVVTRDIPKNCVVVGVPAVLK